MAALASGEIHTAILPPIPFEVGGDGDAPTPEWLKWLKPRAILKTPFGTFDKAPYGAPEDWRPRFAILALGLAALAYFLLRGIVRTVWR